jgi:hypothetical protein
LLSHVPPRNDSTVGETVWSETGLPWAAALQPWGKSKNFRLSFPHVMAQNGSALLGPGVVIHELRGARVAERAT